MRIVVVGAGKLGYSIASLLSKEQFDVIVIDHDEGQLEAVKNTLDVLTIFANGASPITMNDPDIRGADILIAVTASDEVNMVACILAKKHGIRHTIARIRDMQFMSEAKDYLKENFDIDLMLNPELITANEINRILMTPAALDVEDFAHGKIRLFETKVRRSSPLANIPLKDIEFPKGVLAGMIFRDHRMIIPHGDDCLLPHDNAYFIGIPEEIEKFSQTFVQRDARKLHRVIIIGAGRAGRALAPMLEKQGVRVKVIDKDPERCRLMADKLVDGIAICGDGTDIDLIKSENLFGTDGFVALTGRDEENLLMALAARRAGVRKVLAKMTRPNYMELVQETGLGSIISPKDIIANQITRYVRALANSQGMAVESLYKLLGGKVEALEFTASNDGNGILHTPLMKLPLRHGVLLAAIVREGRTIIPGGMTTIEPGDHVLVVTNVPGLTDLKNILA